MENLRHPAGLPLRADPEALLIVGLLEAAPTQSHYRMVFDNVTGDDFGNGMYGRIFEVIRARYEAGKMTDSASVLDELRAGGKATFVLKGVLIELIGLHSAPVFIPQYARLVVNLWYRRQFHRAADFMQQLADEGDDDDLFPQMVELGKQQRAAWTRWTTFCDLTDQSQKEATA